MTEKYHSDACDDLISQCKEWLGHNGYTFCWNNALDSMHIEGRGRKVDIGYEVFLNYATEKYDYAYYREEKIINDMKYISAGWMFNIDDFFNNVVGLNNI